MSVAYTVRISHRARAMRVTVHTDGQVVVTRPRRFRGESIESFVKKYERWIEREVERTKGKRVIMIRRSDISRLKRAAIALARERSDYFARLYGVSYGTISIRAQKSRWGSCSRAGNLSFNYKIAALPADIADYIVVHEICHLIVFDHSRRFWDAVSRVVPDHAAVKKDLKNTVFKVSTRY